MKKRMEEEIQNRLQDPSWSQKIARHVLAEVDRRRRESKTWLVWPAAAALAIAIGIAQYREPAPDPVSSPAPDLIAMAFDTYHNDPIPAEVEAFFSDWQSQ